MADPISEAKQRVGYVEQVCGPRGAPVRCCGTCEHRLDVGDEHEQTHYCPHIGFKPEHAVTLLGFCGRWKHGK